MLHNQTVTVVDPELESVSELVQEYVRRLTLKLRLGGVGCSCQVMKGILRFLSDLYIAYRPRYPLLLTNMNESFTFMGYQMGKIEQTSLTLKFKVSKSFTPFSIEL